MSRSRGLRPGILFAVLSTLGLGLVLPGADVTSAGEPTPIPVLTTPSASHVPKVPAVATEVFAGSGAQRTIALTFDDGWVPWRCLAIANTLTALGVPATWFPNGVYVKRAPEVWHSIGARFPIGNHTYLHLSLPGLPAAKVRREILRDQRLIERIIGHPMVRLLRPPYGATDRKVLRIAARLGYLRAVLWDTTDADTASHVTAHGSAVAALRGRPGSIILMHCGPEVTPVILPIVIARYACAGYRFVTVEELLAGAPGAAANVDCPPPPLPDPEPRHPHGSPEPTARPGPDATPVPSQGPGTATFGEWTVVMVASAADPAAVVPLDGPGWLVVGPSGIVAGLSGCVASVDPRAVHAVVAELIVEPWMGGCADGAGSSLVRLLGRVSGITLAGGTLSLVDAAGGVVMSAVDPTR